MLPAAPQLRATCATALAVACLAGCGAAGTEDGTDGTGAATQPVAAPAPVARPVSADPCEVAEFTAPLPAGCPAPGPGKGHDGDGGVRTPSGAMTYGEVPEQP